MSLAAGGAAALGMALAAPAIGQTTRTIRFGHMLPTDQIHHKAIVMFGDELAKLSSNSKQIFVHSGHNMDLEAPADVTAAIRLVVNAVRSHGKV
jgi:deoxyinosine 3'endonuclease (endonuclease V)